MLPCLKICHNDDISERGESVIVIYDSLTGQSERFAQKISETTINVLDYDGEGDRLFLVTRSYNFGQIPEETLDFLNEYKDRVVGVAVSGNRNWGTNYGAAGDKIQQQFGIELVLKFEGSGFSKDVEFVKEWLEKYKEEKA